MSPILEQLNDQQKAAIMESIDRNVVLMAAAGSGKTKTLVTRTKLLLTEYNVSPSEIMLITFTNKAVNEIKSRILDSCSSIDGMWIGTFHNVCSRIIRKFGFPLGIQNFTILDTDASKKLIKDILTKANMNVEHCVKVQKMISDMKNNLISSKQCMSMPGVNRAFANVYKIYNDTCWQRKTFDFDDMIIYALLLLENQSVQDWFHANVKYVMVDECLVGGSFVRTSDGVKTIKKLYEMYQAGIELPKALSFNLQTKQYEYKEITYAHKSNGRTVFTVTTEGLNKLRCTDNHKVLTQRGYVEVKDLIIGKDMLILSDVNKQKTKNVLNEDQMQICLGSYLGDGHLDKRSELNTFRLNFTQSVDFKDYFDSKIKAFNLPDGKLITSGYTGKQNILRSNHSNTFVLNDDPFKLVLSSISPMGLAIWYQDDGSFNNGRYVRLYSESFTEQQNYLLSEMLYERFHIKTEVKQDKTYFYLKMDAINSDLFLKIVSPFMHPSMQYKTNVDISTNVIKYNNIFENYGANFVSSIKESGIEDVYDITVKDNHNFITSTSFYSTGIIVHNCQDSNKGNFMLVDRIVGNNNVMLFGDYNQSIYGFRNALPKLLLDYSKSHPNTVDMKLEQNYRSTETIIKAANAVILNNGSDIQMFCSNERGEPIRLYTAENDKMEAQWVGIEIRMLRQMIGMKFGDFAIITRTRLQIRVLENIFRANGIPYVVHGNQGFYQRKEVMDLLAYCNLYINEKNVEALKRILKTLTGVGETTAEDILNKMEEDQVSPKNIFRHYVNTAQKISKKALASLTATANLMEQSFDTCSSLVSEIFLSLDYRDKIMTQTTDEAKEKLEVVDEFLVNVMECERDNYSFSISDTITYLMLMSESKKEDKETLDAVKVMTAHSSKGLEFPCVFIIGVEDGLFPHGNAIATGSIDSIQEERRLFYVSITRAMKLLYITSCKQRYRNDSMNTEPCKPSRFIREIPSELTEIRYY